MTPPARLWPAVWSVPDAVDAWSWNDVGVASKPLPIHITFPDAARVTGAGVCSARVEAVVDAAGHLVMVAIRGPEGVGAAGFRPAVAALRGSLVGCADVVDDGWDEGAVAVVTGPTRLVFDMVDAAVVLTPHESC